MGRERRLVVSSPALGFLGTVRRFAGRLGGSNDAVATVSGDLTLTPEALNRRHRSANPTRRIQAAGL
jgi:hypothetical protein